MELGFKVSGVGLKRASKIVAGSEGLYSRLQEIPGPGLLSQKSARFFVVDPACLVSMISWGIQARGSAPNSSQQCN